MRRLIAFDCGGAALLGSLDDGAGTTGLLIVSGGNEIRAGAHRGMALLAAKLAASGTPVFRYDRRGVGDSEGENRGFDHAREDLLAAAAAFRANAPQLARIVGFGNCDAASTLALFGKEAGLDAVLLANPWVVEPIDDLPPPAAIRARYAQRLRDPRQWLRLVGGKISFTKLLRGLQRVSYSSSHDLADRVLTAVRAWEDNATIILAEHDATAIAYRNAARNSSARTITILTASHSFARSADQAALEYAIRAAL